MLISRYLRFPRYFIIYTHTHTYLFLTVLGLRCCSGFSLVTGSRAASLVLERSSRACRLQWLQHVGSVVAPPWLWSAGSAVVRPSRSCSVALWDPPRSGIEPVSPALAGGFFTPEPPGKPDILLLLILN